MGVEENHAEIHGAMAQWANSHDHEFARERKPEFATQESRIPLKRLYTPLDLDEQGVDYLRDLGLPGEYPFTRGINATMYRGQLWSIGHYSGYPSPEESNRLWKSQIKAGAKAVRIAYDLPTQLGYDPDHPLAEGEVGRVGVSLTSLKDWEIAFDGIDLRDISVGQVLNAPAIVGLANHLCLSEQRRIPPEGIRGVLQNDILKEYTARGAYIFPPKPSMRLTGDILYYVGLRLKNYSSISVCTVHQSEKGADPVQEAAFGLANAFTYLQASVDRGVSVDDIAPNMMFMTACDHTSFFEEICKHRAMRRIYARTLKERFKAGKPESQMARLYAAQGGTTLHREQYLTNIARSSIAALAAALSGCQAMGVRPYDEQFGIPTEEAVGNALMVQHMIANETGIADTVDWLAGSYAIEWLTGEIEKRINRQLEEIEAKGGVLKCIEDGYFQELMVKKAKEWQRGFEAGDIIRVGVNAFKSHHEERPTKVYRSDPAVEESRKKALYELKQVRDNSKVISALGRLKQCAMAEASRENNLVAPVIEAARCYATLGEITDVLRTAWGEYRES